MMHSRPLRLRKTSIVMVAFTFILAVPLVPLLVCTVSAGPPFLTDDPVPVDLHAWEAYIATQGETSSQGTALTAPHIELNYGPLPDVQVHVIAPFQYTHSSESTEFGFGDLEVGAKYRFIGATDSDVQIGLFPLVLLPTGNEDKGLGDGRTRLFVPVWIQVSFAGLTSYGGAGLWINTGGNNLNSVFAGWQVQGDLSASFHVGGEVFFQTPESDGSTSTYGVNVGAIIDLTGEHHLLFSAGYHPKPEQGEIFYAGYQLTIGSVDE